MIPKFRAWHKEYKKWCEPYSFTIKDLMTIGFSLSVYDEDCCMSVSFEDIELMQWTGLIDKNGKDIYCDDICKVWGTFYYQDETLSYYIGHIFYHDISGKLVITSEKMEYSEDYCDLLTSDYAELEVIGNIHEQAKIETRFSEILQELDE